MTPQGRDGTTAGAFVSDIANEAEHADDLRTLLERLSRDRGADR